MALKKKLSRVTRDPRGSFHTIFDTRALRIFLLLFLLWSIGYGAIALYRYTHLKPRNIPEELAVQMTSLCNVGRDHTVCYEREVPKLFPKYSIPLIFDVIRNIRKRDQSYQFCHVLAHKLGEKIVAQDPDRWMQAMPLNPSDGLCSNGFTHGVIGGRFRANVLTDDALDALLPDFRKACEAHDNWKPTPSIQATCYHGLGHLYVYITDAHLHKALSLCARTTDTSHGDYGQVCREGVFMQIYQPLEPDDFLMIEQMPVRPATSTIRQFCSSYNEDPRDEGACLRESWPFSRISIMNGTGVAAFCAHQPNAKEEYNCYRSATAIIGRSSLGHGDSGNTACSHLPQLWQGVCAISVASAILEEDLNAGPAAIAACTNVSLLSASETCLSTFADHVQFYFGSDPVARAAFCHALPEPQRTVCLR